MKYTQNERINQVKESSLIIGVDIAKAEHVARAQDFRGVEFSKPITFENTRKGFKKFLSWLEVIKQEQAKEEVLVGMEPTGQYWLTLAQFLKQTGIQTILVNPNHVKKSKELDDNSPTKNDIKDAKVIAQLVKDGRYSVPNIPTGIYAELRNGMNLRDRLTDDLRRVKGRIDNWLDRYFPEFSTVFKNWDGKAALLTLKNFPLPKEILGHSEEEIVSCWKREVNRAVGKKRARKLKEAAKNSTGITEGEIMARQELKTLLSQYDALIEELEQVLVQIENILKEIPGAEEMMSIPGVGMVTVAGFLAEVGDLSNYQHPNQIKKLAGLNLKENSSGKHKGETKITKRGRPRLRGLLYRCVIPLVAKNPEFKLLHDYYTTRPENPLKKKQSLVALACRLIRVLFALGTKKTPYNGRMMLKNSSLNLLQDAA
ncbi:IS110 family transposase [Natranaerobius thermophilus]|uniref:Transposase IS116/IS110/IS902 family protein n=1 Tax=Natranaerobius thermophilus (strain ATCC BAA-1301 / DSM 18059 / JW/NM-WN-LF) TaxID=457570 RepID=B2A2R8_NATTJ|nr:IS110 family transposase [Natranaerobius thermophilus]ACB83834.1 transposase IS116/IS110/IS902 family protein [Natranaerobius thermophilus JW/NM-WN-LF]ACB85712.1 transposase IS116/IS110/IS902 family protein [Natranaerobius thermophilus JW/NM-WN-LF]ACB86286.1 transposase IS116/IS110/IS902 family protein [Natranaerobius thermophilus JW/NM-WN-LF]